VPDQLVLASANPDKVAEISALLGAKVVLQARPGHLGEVVESGRTLEENARLKARAVADAAGLPAVADDTGLEVDALGGAPGVHSARYAGKAATYADNVAKLLAELERVGAVDEDSRLARFRTVAMVCFPDGSEVASDGFVLGIITRDPRGAGGFGYDPVFVPVEGDGRTFGELEPHEKHGLSHRGRAFRSLAIELGLH
jgi:XTP/dITP diphosphohydrolase